jgi:kinesin family protein 18/19
MVGTPDNPGIMFRMLNDLYNKVEKQKIVKDFTIKVSYMEIYNENIKDLLTSEDRNLDIREDPEKGVVINAITEA